MLSEEEKKQYCFKFCFYGKSIIFTSICNIKLILFGKLYGIKKYVKLSFNQELVIVAISLLNLGRDLINGQVSYPLSLLNIRPMRVFFYVQSQQLQERWKSQILVQITSIKVHLLIPSFIKAHQLESRQIGNMSNLLVGKSELYGKIKTILNSLFSTFFT